MNKVAAIVGGGRSLGEYLCKFLAKREYRVAVLDIDISNAERVAKEIKDNGGNAEGFYIDACKEESVGTAFDSVVDEFGSIDAMIYNAGIAKSRMVVEFELRDFIKCMDINLVGYFLCARKTAEIMIDKGVKGRIIQINSKSGKVGSKFNCGYSAAKFGGVGLTQSIALDLAEYGITVNSLMLGNLLYSDMFQSLVPSYAKKLGVSVEEVVPIYINKVPLKRGCEFEDVANVLYFYISDEASYCTGQSINITGGQVMH